MCAVVGSSDSNSQRRPVSSSTSRKAQASSVSPDSILPLGNVQSLRRGRWMSSSSGSLPFVHLTMTPPAALTRARLVMGLRDDGARGLTTAGTPTELATREEEAGSQLQGGHAEL